MAVVLSNKYISASIHTTGAELFSLKSDLKQYIWEGNPDYWGKHSPVLFPIVGSLKNDRYIYQAKQYKLPRHGFARDRNFEFIQQSDTEALFSLSSDRHTREMYPFDFKLQVKYTLHEKCLNIEYIVENKDSITLPFSLGAHPAFALPGKFSDYCLMFNTNDELIRYRLDNGLLSEKNNAIPLPNNKLNLDYSLFADDAIVIKNIPQKEITIKENNKPILKVSFPDFPDLGLWTKSGAPFICIEPWHGYADSIEASGNIMDKEGIITLKSGKTFRTHYSIEILE